MGNSVCTYMSHGPVNEYRYKLTSPTLTSALEQMESTLNEEGKFWKIRREYLEKKKNKCTRRHVDDVMRERDNTALLGSWLDWPRAPAGYPPPAEIVGPKIVWPVPLGYQVPPEWAHQQLPGGQQQRFYAQGGYYPQGATGGGGRLMPATQATGQQGMPAPYPVGGMGYEPDEEEYIDRYRMDPLERSRLPRMPRGRMRRMGRGRRRRAFQMPPRDGLEEESEEGMGEEDFGEYKSDSFKRSRPRR